MPTRKSAHQNRLDLWLRLAPVQTRDLCALVMERVVPNLLAAGFQPAECTLGNPDWQVPGKEIELERWGLGFVDGLTFNFDKYKRPRFQVHASRRSPEPPYPFIHSGNLVAHPRQYYYFWGKPWWLPLPLWSRRNSEATICRVTESIGQLLKLLEYGERGDNVSRE